MKAAKVDVLPRLLLSELKRTRSSLGTKRQFITADYVAAQRHVENTTRGLFQLSVRKPCEFHRYEIRTATVAGTVLSFVSVDSDCGYAIEVSDNPDLVLLQIPLRGDAYLQQGDVRVSAGPAQMILHEAKTQSRKRWRGSTQLLMVRLDRRRLEQAISDATGLNIATRLSFGVAQVVGLSRVTTLLEYILMICRDLGDGNLFGNGHLAVYAERMLALLVLETMPNNYEWALKGRVPSSAAPHYVYRVEQYIREHAHRRIECRDLVAASGVSARSVFAGFRRFRSTTPLAYLKTVRLDRAREALRQRKTSVTQAAIAVGYGNLSQFSRDYRLQFKECPSSTLGDARGHLG